MLEMFSFWATGPVFTNDLILMQSEPKYHIIKLDLVFYQSKVSQNITSVSWIRNFTSDSDFPNQQWTQGQDIFGID